MAKMIQVPYDISISVPVATAQSVQKNYENPISLEALGLLVNLLSYPSSWELHKTELYKRFAKHGERSVKAAWKDLMESNYIIEFRYRSGKKYEYVYYFRKVPFSNEEKAQILDTAAKEYGVIWGLQNEDPKLKSSKRRGNQKNIINKKHILNTNNNDIQKFDDDKRTTSLPHDEEYINLIISNFKEATKGELTERSFKSVIRKVIDKYNQGKVNSFRDYLATALIRKIEELELRRIKDNAKQQSQVDKEKRANTLTNLEISTKVPFYDWLNE